MVNVCYNLFSFLTMLTDHKRLTSTKRKRSLQNYQKIKIKNTAQIRVLYQQLIKNQKRISAQNSSKYYQQLKQHQHQKTQQQQLLQQHRALLHYHQKLLTLKVNDFSKILLRTVDRNLLKDFLKKNLFRRSVCKNYLQQRKYQQHHHHKQPQQQQQQQHHVKPNFRLKPQQQQQQLQQQARDELQNQLGLQQQHQQQPLQHVQQRPHLQQSPQNDTDPKITINIQNANCLLSSNNNNNNINNNNNNNAIINNANNHEEDTNTNLQQSRPQTLDLQLILTTNDEVKEDSSSEPIAEVPLTPTLSENEIVQEQANTENEATSEEEESSREEDGEIPYLTFQLSSNPSEVPILQIRHEPNHHREFMTRMFRSRNSLRLPMESYTLTEQLALKRNRTDHLYDANDMTSSPSLAKVNKCNGSCVPQGVVALLEGRYLFVRKIDGTSFYNCIDVKTRQELTCKAANNPCSKFLAAHFRLSGHPHINHPIKVIQKANKTYLFFPTSKDDLLSYVLSVRRLCEADARHIFRQMCLIVKSCHEQGIVLRDLKLRKFVFTDNERKHLILESLEDAVLLDDPNNDLLEDKRGCPVYVAPEILKANRTYYGKAADMWSLGVILYTMVVGRYPFNDSDHAGLFAKISRGRYSLPQILPPKVRCLIRSLLRQEPDERLTSEDILSHPWMVNKEEDDLDLSSDDQCVPEMKSNFKIFSVKETEI